MVTARAVIVDLARDLVRSLNLVAGVGGIARIVGPLLSGVILQFSHWRTSFWVVAAPAATVAVCLSCRSRRGRSSVSGNSWDISSSPPSPRK